MNLFWKVAIIIHKFTKRLSMWIIPPFLVARVLVVIVQNDCFQMLLIVCSPLPPTLSHAAWTVMLRCVFNWLPGEAETTEDDRPTHHFLSPCPCLLFRWLGHPFNQNLLPGYIKNIKLLQRREEAVLHLLNGWRESVMLLRLCSLSTSAEHSCSTRRTKYMWPGAL